MAIKTVPTKESVNAFLKDAATPERAKEGMLMKKLMQDATGQKPVMWGESIVGFGSYQYHYQSGQEGVWPLVAFSPRKASITVYITPGFNGYEALLKKLGPHKISGGSCLYIKRLSDIDMPTLSKLVERSYKDMRKKYSA